MTKETLAAALHGNARGKEISCVMAQEAKLAGLVVVYGTIDYWIKFRGAINADEGCGWQGTTLLVTPEGLWDEESCAEQCCHYAAALARAEQEGQTITALWDSEEPYTWTYKTAIPHATFDILEDGEPWCRGIVFALADAHQ